MTVRLTPQQRLQRFMKETKEKRLASTIVEQAAKCVLGGKHLLWSNGSLFEKADEMEVAEEFAAGREGAVCAVGALNAARLQTNDGKEIFKAGYKFAELAVKAAELRGGDSGSDWLVDHNDNQSYATGSSWGKRNVQRRLMRLANALRKKGL